MLLGGGLPRFCENLLGSSNGFLSFLVLHAAGRGVSFFDQFRSLPIRLQNDVATCGFRLGQFASDPLRVRYSLCNLLPSFIQYFQDRLEGEAMEKDTDN